ncbi:hypothetical protein I7I50_07362 [Histoplasma capsulatum G186AR]|uniref:Myb/SANT-like domain-containing protein n=1 Tax=Ajellomyces capsulatus TaxID=5037 RepID=A0A8H7YZM9_AJECA|nr:hypothetical protein I7I52_09566 [Histoplasma capsulatum]QSS68077.1 hypothetical protein I7I50_07362 [Histoplasma capsulatum G186AR]
MDLDESQIDPTSQYLDEPLISESQRPDSPMLATRATQRASPPYTQRARRGPRVQTDWTPDMELAMLNTFIDAKKQGLETDNSNYKSVVWPSIVDAVSQHTHQSITKDICENRWRKIKTIWRLWHKHQQQISGWSFCQEKMTFINDIEVTSMYFNQHPEMRQFQHQGPVYPELTGELLDGRLATDDYAIEYHAHQQRRREEMMSENTSDVGTEEELTFTSTSFLTPTPVVESLGAAYQSSASSSQSPARMSTETSTRNQPLKRKFGDSIDALREVIRESATAKLRVEQPDDIKQATRLFLSEIQDLLPEDWKVDGQIPYSQYSKIPLLFRDPNISGLYLGYSAGSIEDQ